MRLLYFNGLHVLAFRAASTFCIGRGVLVCALCIVLLEFDHWILLFICNYRLPPVEILIPLIWQPIHRLLEVPKWETNHDYRYNFGRPKMCSMDASKDSHLGSSKSALSSRIFGNRILMTRRSFGPVWGSFWTLWACFWSEPFSYWAWLGCYQRLYHRYDQNKDLTPGSICLRLRWRFESLRNGMMI